jgi:hypothetical protein
MSPELRAIFKLHGTEFVRELLAWEQRRFSAESFAGHSAFEEICADFGQFPRFRAYPVYFVGDLDSPRNKHVFIGINPGYKQENNSRENEYLDRVGLYEGYCKIFRDFFPGDASSGKRYYSNLFGFCRRQFSLEERSFAWQWFHENVIHLDLIPFHSASVQGLAINDLTYFKERYFEVLLKILRYLSPQEPVFFNGFPTIASLLRGSNGRRGEEIKAMIEFEKRGAVYRGKIAGEFNFIGLPFQTRVKGGKDQLVANLREIDKSDPSSWTR